MSSKVGILLLVLFVIIATSLATYFSSKKNLGDEIWATEYRKGTLKEVDQAIDAAKVVYERRKELDTDFSEGPCLSNDLMPDWVADIAYDPRLKIDDDPKNQCVAYMEGRAHHFVELDPEGNLIRVK